MKYRCTAAFVRAFDRLPTDAQAQALRALQRFNHSPRVPHRDVRLIYSDEARAVYDLPFAQNHHLTYAIITAAEDEDNCICVLRAIGPTQP